MRFALTSLFLAASAVTAHADNSPWNAFYVGVHAGYGSVDTGVDLSNSTGAIFYNDPFDPTQGELSSVDAFFGGLQIGADRQIGSLVIGLEADVSWSDAEADGQFTTPLGSRWDITSSLDTLATVRGRAGFLASPALLIYGTAGLAWGKVDVTQATTFVDANGAFLDDGGRTSGTFNHVGYAVGAGFEYAFAPNWSLKTEYLFIDLGEEDYQLKGTTKPGGKTPYVETFSSDIEIHTVRMGVNYRF
jgi:outer membrane immunogenic protein